MRMRFGLCARANADLHAHRESRSGLQKRATRVQNIAREASRSSLPAESDLQLLYARLNFVHFAGELPSYRIVYNRRMTSVAGRITYRPPLIELSVPLLGAHPSDLPQTM